MAAQHLSLVLMTRAASQDAVNTARIAAAAAQEDEKSRAAKKFFHFAFSYITSRSPYNPNRTRSLPVEAAKNNAAHQDLVMRDWRGAEWALLQSFGRCVI